MSRRPQHAGNVIGVFSTKNASADAISDAPGERAKRDETHFVGLRRRLKAGYRSTAPRAFPGFARSGAALERAFPDEPAWYLETLGIHPDAQRRGVGGALLAAGLAMVDADHVACHLHTSDEANLAYYGRWGFELTYPGFPASPGGPTYCGMTRPGVR